MTGNNDAGAVLRTAAWKGDIPGLKQLLADGADPDAVADDGCAALHLAAEAGRPECMRVLLEAGADPNVQDDSGLAPLHVASLTGHVGAITLLVKAGADPEMRDEERGETPLCWAVAGVNEMEAVRGICTLVGAGADPNARNGLGWTPMQRLCANPGHGEVLRCLLAAGSDPDGTDEDGFTVLHHLALALPFDSERLSILVSGGADVNARDGKGRTPLYLAAERGQVEWVQALLGVGADPSIPGKAGVPVDAVMQRPAEGDTERRETILEMLREAVGHAAPEPGP